MDTEEYNTLKQNLIEQIDSAENKQQITNSKNRNTACTDT